MAFSFPKLVRRTTSWHRFSYLVRLPEEKWGGSQARSREDVRKSRCVERRFRALNLRIMAGQGDG